MYCGRVKPQLHGLNIVVCQDMALTPLLFVQINLTATCNATTPWLLKGHRVQPPSKLMFL